MNLNELKENLTTIYKELNDENLYIIRDRVKEVVNKYNGDDWISYVNECGKSYNRELI